MAKAAHWLVTDAEARKRGDQTGYRDWETQLTREVDRLGSTVARLKLKGIDGGPHKRWMMWINSMQREKPYLPLTCTEVR